MGIEEKVMLAKETKDEKLIEEIIKHYEPIFCANVCKKYGNKYREYAKEILPGIVNYYIENNFKSKLNIILASRVEFLFDNKNFNNIIKSENSLYIKKHYIEKMYNMLNQKNISTILDNNQIRKLCEVSVENMYENYLKNDKKSSVSNYFNSTIIHKINMLSEEEKIVLYYTNNVGINDKIVKYFANKYEFVFKEYSFLNKNEYKNIVDKILKHFYFPTFNFEATLRKEIINMKHNKAEIAKSYINLLKNSDFTYYNEIKEYYSYLINIVYEKYKKDVMVSNKQFKEILENKYDIYFEKGVHYLIRNDNASLSGYINTRLTKFAKSNELCEKVYVDLEKKEKNIKSNFYLVDFYSHKYVGTLPKEKVINILTNNYYEIAEKYYKKNRKSNFDVYLKVNLNNTVNNIDFLYSDDCKKEITK